MPNDEIDLVAQLYDSQGKLQDISNKNIVWSFINPKDSSQESDLSSVILSDGIYNY
jgi:hypothetical protein